MTVMAILQEVDKCMRCNGCVVACKRTWGMKSETIGVQKVAYDQRLAIKSQKRVDMGPFVRFTCWHCPDPPCASACPYSAIVKRANGAVDVDETKCRPDLCRKNGQYPCQVGCQRGGYPKIGIGRFSQSAPKSNKCTLCYGKAGLDDPTKPMLQTRAAQDASGNYLSTLTGQPLPEMQHEPACVSSCPAKAMTWDSQANIKAYLSDPANGFILADGTRNWIGNGSLFWASKTVLLAPPKADPLVEDHLAPLAADLSGSLGGLVVPTLVVGGLMALSARRARVEEDSATTGGEV